MHTRHEGMFTIHATTESMNLVNSVTCYLYQFALHSFMYIVATHVYPISLISLEQKIHWNAFLLYTLHTGIHQNIKNFSLFSARNTNKYCGSSTGQWIKTYYRRHILVKTDGVKYTACDLYTNMEAYIFTMRVFLNTLNIILMLTYVHNNVKIKIHVLIWHLHTHYVGMTNYTLQYLINIDG